MTNNTFDNVDFETLLDQFQHANERQIEQEFSRFIQASPLRQEIFNAIEQLETSKIRLIDNEFKSILNRWR